MSTAVHEPLNRPLRVAVWTTGNVVRQAVRVILGRSDLSLVGAFAYSPSKAGVDVGELCGLDRPIGVLATSDVDELLAQDLDCVVYSPLHFVPADVERLLRSGVNVVATAEFMTGTNLGEAVRSRLDEAGRAGGATLFGSGMNPGFAQLLAGVAAGITAGVQTVTVSESVDVGQFVSDANFADAGWGRPKDDPGHADDVCAATEVFAEAVDVLGRLLGVDLDGRRCDVDFAHATQDVELPGLTIRAGHVAAMDVRWTGIFEGCDVIGVHQRWLATEHVDPPWTVEHGYVIEVQGDPNVRLKLDIWPTDADLADLTRDTMHGIGMRITAVPVVNAIPAVCAAVPGIATYADLRVITSPIGAPQPNLSQ
jgi:hypothetical protein